VRINKWLLREEVPTVKWPYGSIIPKIVGDVEIPKSVPARLVKEREEAEREHLEELLNPSVEISTVSKDITQ
jgi:hypothetical protein